MSGPHRHLHHSDERAAFRLVRERQTRANALAILAAAGCLLLIPRSALWKFPALLLTALLFLAFSLRNWRCPQCHTSLPYGRVPEDFSCSRCDAVLQWRHPPA
jgi:hypothetical protein